MDLANVLEFLRCYRPLTWCSFQVKFRTNDCKIFDTSNSCDHLVFSWIPQPEKLAAFGRFKVNSMKMTVMFGGQYCVQLVDFFLAELDSIHQSTKLKVQPIFLAIQ